MRFLHTFNLTYVLLTAILLGLVLLAMAADVRPAQAVGVIGLVIAWALCLGYDQWRARGTET